MLEFIGRQLPRSGSKYGDASARVVTALDSNVTEWHRRQTLQRNVSPVSKIAALISGNIKERG